MKTKVLQVFYNENGLPFKDQERTVHFPIVGSGFMGASNTTQIKFYFKEIGDDAVKYVAVSKLPNGEVGSKVLENYYDSELDEPYALLELDSYYTQYKGDLFISLQGYQGGVQVTYDEDTELYEIEGTPTIQATGSIKFTNNYATQFVGSGEEQNITLQQLLAIISDTVLRYYVNSSNTLAEVFNEIGTKICAIDIEGDEYLCEMSGDTNIVLYDIHNQEWYAFTGANTTTIDEVMSSDNKQIIATKEDLENFGNLFTYKGTASVSEINALTDIGNGWCYNLTDSGTLTLGNLQVETGDNVAFNGTIWTKLSSETVLGNYYTKQQGQTFEQNVNNCIGSFENGVNNQISAIENQVQQVASGSPKGVYVTLSDLQTAYPSGTTGIYVVSATGHWYYWNGSAWTDGGTYQSAVGVVPETRKIANTSLSSDISPEELSNNLLPFNELLQFIPGFNKSAATTVSGYNDIAKNIVLIKGFKYTATWTFNQALEVGGYAYLVDENGVNQFTGSTRIEIGATSLQVTITPTETKLNLTARVYIGSQDIGKICTFEMTAIGNNKIQEINNTISLLKPSSFQDYKGMMSFGIGDIRNGVFTPDVYPYRISNDVRYTFDTDVIIKVDDGFRVGYCTYETMEQETTDQWSGWKTGTFTIPANTKFQLQCAKASNEDADGPITDAYDNPIYNAMTIKVKTEYEQSVFFEYGHSGLKTETFYGSALWSQGACLIDDLIVGFNASNDDHTNTATYNSFFFENGYELNTLANHNLGHCASADYNKETDTMLVANGTYAASVTPTIYLISNAKNTVTNGENILVTNNNVTPIELNNSLGEGVVACFGENSNIVYAMQAEDAANFSTKSKKYLYKLFLGKGTNNMVSQYPTKSFGTFISGKAANEYNGTAYIMGVYEGDYYIELQGMKFLNGRVIISCDTYENNTDLTAYLVSLKINENNNTFEVEKCLYVPSLNDIGGYIRTEAEDVVFDENYGYIVTYSSTAQITKTLKFNINNL